MGNFKSILGVLLALFYCLNQVSAYDGTACCDLAIEQQAWIIKPEEPICGQTYNITNKDKPASPLNVTYTWCAANCPGIGLSQFNDASQCAAPIVQFILPSVIFSMSVPRRKKIEFDYLFDWPVELTTKTRYKLVNHTIQLVVSLVCFVIILIPVIIDTTIWIVVIILGAGNMLVGGLYEAQLDYRLVKYVRAMEKREETAGLRTELLVTVTSGNLRLEKGDPQTVIPKSLTVSPCSRSGISSTGYEKCQSRLLNLLGAQSSFGLAVGSPV